MLREGMTWPKGDWRNLYFTPEHLREILPRVERLKTLLPDGMPLPELVLRFILHHPAVATIIPGMRKVRHVEANLAASDRGPLDSSLVEALRPYRWDRTYDIP
jgi:aryl-alcohol dehydrogenase-like predicted oxidoreductase